MKANPRLTALLFLFALLPASRADSFNQCRATHFTSAQLADPNISGPDADTDSDQLRDFSEYVLGTDPLASSMEPALTSGFVLESSDGLLHLCATFQLPLEKLGLRRCHLFRQPAPALRRGSRGAKGQIEEERPWHGPEWH